MAAVEAWYIFPYPIDVTTLYLMRKQGFEFGDADLSIERSSIELKLPKAWSYRGAEDSALHYICDEEGYVKYQVKTSAWKFYDCRRLCVIPDQIQSNKQRLREYDIYIYEIDANDYMTFVMPPHWRIRLINTSLLLKNASDVTIAMLKS